MPPDAIVDPWAVVVHVENTPLTNAAVMSTLWPIAIAPLARCNVFAIAQARLPAIDHLDGHFSRQRRDCSRIREHRFDMGPTRHHQQGIENDPRKHAQRSFELSDVKVADTGS
eukprot:TRINITY_DN10510_c0_g1_i1.p2 TRINITY_DN10510_c0_g1~~TRINITY_DN10510_c0_g1_i1.p2  ORF type:complete len:113 (-),score=9.06 TRINITY_DN10510_c0_g1_i1:180-518(-)